LETNYSSSINELESSTHSCWCIEVYEWSVTKDESPTPREKLIRVPVRRRGVPVELRVHYEITRVDGCDSYRILNIEEPE